MYDGSIYERELPDGRVIVVYPMLYTFRVCIGASGDSGYEDAWCYPREFNVLRAAEEWTGDGDPPDGWTRQPTTGRRRPGGDPALEYVEP